MFYLDTIIMLPLIMIIMAIIVSMTGSYYQSMHRSEVAFQLSGSIAAQMYPQCANLTPGQDPMNVVHANINGNGPQELSASMQIGFGMVTWIAIFLHAVGVEDFLNLTPAKGQRLRNASYGRQLEAGFERPGSAGLTVDRWGDSKT